jgi:2-phospho-L-lactate guanylyltransferase
MLEDVLSALQMSTVDETVVVSNDFTVRDFAGKFGATHLAQKTSGLNPAIEEATEWCMQKGAEAVLVLPADIPLLSSADVDKIVELGNCGGQTVVLSRSYDGGTNALFQSPPNLIHVCFGPRSFVKHIKEAYSRGVCVKLHYSTGVATDIDSADDLGKLLKTEGNTACRRVLNQFNLAVVCVKPFRSQNRHRMCER